MLKLNFILLRRFLVVAAAGVFACTQVQDEVQNRIDPADPADQTSAPAPTPAPAPDQTSALDPIPVSIPGMSQDTYREMVKRFDEAAKNLTRLSPMEFENVPLEVREELSERGCTIPQTVLDEKYQNVISGEFAAPGQTDWAALCSRDGSSAIVVIWGGPVQCPSTAEEARPDEIYLQTWGEPIVNGYALGVAFSRLISTFPASIPALYKMDEGLPDQRTHDSINDYFLEKAGISLYCHEGRWIEFGTSD